MKTLPLTDRWLLALPTWLLRPERVSDEYAERLLRVGHWLVKRSRSRG